MSLVLGGDAGADVRLRGIVWMVGANVAFTALDTLAKVLGQSIDPLQIAWFRYASNLVLILLVLRAWRRPYLFDTSKPLLQVLRGLCLLGSTAFNFVALLYLQLAEAAAINFAGPLFITALAGPLLGEKIGWRRWGAVGVGFLGMLVVIRPGFGGIHWAALFSIASVVSYAFYIILTRHLGRTETAEGLVLHGALVGTVVLMPTLPPVWDTPTSAWLWIGLCATGLIGGVGHFMLIQAYKRAPATVIAPFTYMQIVWMVIAGYLVFGDRPDVWTLYGAGIIISSGLYILHRERVVRGG